MYFIPLFTGHSYIPGGCLGSLSHDLRGFYTSQTVVGYLGFLNPSQPRRRIYGSDQLEEMPEVLWAGGVGDLVDVTFARIVAP